MPRSGKGSEFERSICKQLSLWWTDGERDDVFWRTSQSGGRATQRSKKGQKTYGSYSDIAAVDPIGEPLLKLFNIELKRGSSYSCPGDLLDFKVDNASHPWVKCLLQTMRCQEESGSHGWLMICKRDHRSPVVFIDSFTAHSLVNEECGGLRYAPFFSLKLAIYQKKRFITKANFMGTTLENFLQKVKPKQIIACVKKL
jgi:hypothetical protein